MMRFALLVNVAAAMKMEDTTKSHPVLLNKKNAGNNALKAAVGAAMVGSATAMGDFLATDNPCNVNGDDTKQQIWTDLADIPCYSAEQANEVRDGDPFILNGATAVDSGAVQSGADVSVGVRGELEAALDPVRTKFADTCTTLGCMAAVNVHWHLGAEHLNTGTYDLDGDEWIANHGVDSDHRRRAAETNEPGHFCPGYDENDPKYTTEYDWQYCEDMHVGYTYETHWPNSNLGAQNMPGYEQWQYQTAFMDGVLCYANYNSLSTVSALDTVFESELTKIGVQAQVYQIVNDAAYDYPNWEMLQGWNDNGADGFAQDVAIYQGSTTGHTDGNIVCRGTGGAVTWQVDRGCHLISAWKFDDLCRQMLEQPDDMSGDIHPHNSRETVDPALASNADYGSTDLSTRARQLATNATDQKYTSTGVGQ